MHDLERALEEIENGFKNTIHYKMAQSQSYGVPKNRPNSQN